MSKYIGVAGGAMQDIEILLNEYNNLWQEKIVHKNSIRKFHNYLTYITAIGSLALTFNGLSTSDFFKFGADQQTTHQILTHASSIINLIFVPFAPVLFITLTFPLNDTFHIYAIGNQIGALETKLNDICDRNNLTWEHLICPSVYGGRPIEDGTKIINLITAGDYFLLVPTLAIIAGVTTYFGFKFICNETKDYIIPCHNIWGYIYLVIVLYMFAILVTLGFKLKKYVKPDGPLSKIISFFNTLVKKTDP